MAEDASQKPKQSVDDVLKDLNATPEGLTSQEAESRLSRYGPNALEEKKVNPLLKILGYFWGPIPWMIEAAAVLSALVGHWADLTIILVMLVFNAGVGLFEEHKAENALAALKGKLALKARALRDGKWGPVEAKNLVPGDIVRLRLGDVIPADAVCLDGDYLSVDQAALTGESLPVSKKKGDTVYSGSVAKQGEMVAVVTATGNSTFFGRTAQLVASAGAVSHFQKAVMTIGNYLIYLTLALVAVLVLVGLERGESPLELLQFALILTVAAIPVAMPAVLSVTMAVGGLALSRMKAIVSRLEAIEEMAGMDILCSDKTGTLTQNQLTLGDPLIFAAKDADDLIVAGGLASKAEDQDAIDLAILGSLPDQKVLESYKQTTFTPFDPVSKRTEATITDGSGNTYLVTKGAPQVVLGLCDLPANDKERAETSINELASKGYRTLGVARRQGEGAWSFLGILPLYDPPREDSAETIAKAGEHGIEVKMVTGDNAAIGREISRQLGLGTKIEPAETFFGDSSDVSNLGATVEERIERADGFAQVFPEHKFGIVKALQNRGHLVGMTGDGVNDAPALKQADVGVAVSGATDAARAAADLVLTAPGLSVIIDAVEYARRIFERMNSYAIYRITETIRIMLFVVLVILTYGFYPITAVMIILLALLNDVPIMTIAYDNTYLEPKPVRWNMRRVMTLASVLGVTGVIGSFGMLIIAKTYLKLDVPEVQSFVFLKLAIAGHLTLFAARTRQPFWKPPYPAPVMLWSALVTKVLATVCVGMGWFVAPLPWKYVALVWGYCIVWFVVTDRAKLMVYRHLSPEGPHIGQFLGRINRTLHHHSAAEASK